MKKYLLHIGAVFLMTLFSLPAIAAINGSGYYIVRNAERNAEYITIANDFFHFSTVISDAGGASGIGRSQGIPYALRSAKVFLGNDIHLNQVNNNTEVHNPAEVIYLDDYGNNRYNLIAQGTSLLTLTTGKHVAGKGQWYEKTFYFSNIYLRIKSISNTNYYSAHVIMKDAGNNANLGYCFFTDSIGKFTFIRSTSEIVPSEQSARWIVEPLEYFNVHPDVAFNGKYYTTLFVPFSYALGDNINRAYVISGTNSGELTYLDIASVGDTIPAGTPVILECNSSEEANCKLWLDNNKTPIYRDPDPETESGSPRADTTKTYLNSSIANLLKGTYYCNTDAPVTYPYLRVTGGNALFGYTYEETPKTYNGTYHYQK